MAIGDDDRSPEMFNVTLSLLVAATVTVALRCYVRIFMLKTFRIEDWLALVTLVGHTLQSRESGVDGSGGRAWSG